MNKTNRCIDLQFYWYYYSTCFGQPFCPSSGVLNRTSALVCTFYAVVMTVCCQEQDGTAFHPVPGSKPSGSFRDSSMLGVVCEASKSHVRSEVLT